MADKKTCLDAALAFLGRREHAVKELRTKLMRKEYAAAEVNQVIEKLTEKKLLSDERYADARARYRAQVSRWGAGRIRQELKMAGITESGAEVALSRLSDDGILLIDGAKTVAKRAQPMLKRTRMVQALDPALTHREKMEAHQKARQKLLGKLLRKGFTLSEAKTAIAEAEAESFE